MLLNVEGLNSGYGERRILKDISIQVIKGEIVCILGANGAGKTTLIKTITGYIKAKSGGIEFKNKNIVGIRTHNIVTQGISYVPQGNIIFTELSVNDNLIMGAFREKNKSEIKTRMQEIFELFPIINQRLNQKAGTMSGGERQILGVAMALMTKPELLIMDEPSFGLAPIIIDNIFDKLQLLCNKGMTLLIAEQNVARTLDLAHRGYIIELGEIRYHDTAKNLANNEEIKKAYLGE